MHRAIELFYVFFQGIVIFQALVFIVIYFLNRKKDILFYGLFLVCIAAYFFINAPYTFFGIPEEDVWNSAWYNYVNTPVIITSNIFYLLFHQAFFSDLTKSEFIKKIFRLALLLMLAFFALFMFLSILKINSQFIYYSAKIIIIFPAMVVAYFIVKQRLPFYKLITTGLILVVLGTSMTAWFDYRFSENLGTSIFATTYPFLFIKLGLLGEMIFYLTALLKKWNYLERSILQKDYERVLEMEKLKNEISKELHDDIGSTLSGIQMYSHLAAEQNRLGLKQQSDKSLNLIKEASGEMIRRLNDMVWALQPGKFTMEELAEKIKEHAVFMAGAKNIQLNTGIQIESDCCIATEWRHHVFMIAKEIVNNAVKHAGASIINIEIKEVSNYLTLEIADNGIGFDFTTINYGQGLKNLRERAEDMGADLVIDSEEDKGTRIRLKSRIDL